MARPRLVMLCNAQTPYRLALHLRIAREMPEFELESVFTHEVSNSPWVIDSPPEIGPVFFGRPGGKSGKTEGVFEEWRKGGRLIEHFSAHPPAVVVLHGYNDLGRLRVLTWLARQGIPTFLWADSNVRSDQATGVKRAIKHRLLSYVLRQTAGVMVCGTLGKAFFISYGADPARVFFVPYEPDYEAIRALPADKISEVARTFGFVPGRRRLVYSGRLAPEKRVDLLLNAWQRLAPERPDWDLVIVGDGPLRKELEALIPPALTTRTSFLGFQGEQATVSAIYRNADALCLPSAHEPWALVINEAAAAGLAIVASDVVGAAAELVREGVNGKIFPSKDLDALTAALRQVTAGGTIDSMKRASPTVLADWRRRGDPIAGLRLALNSALGLAPESDKR